MSSKNAEFGTWYLADLAQSVTILFGHIRDVKHCFFYIKNMVSQYNDNLTENNLLELEESSEVKGFRRSKDTQIKGELLRGHLGILQLWISDGVGGYY